MIALVQADKENGTFYNVRDSKNHERILYKANTDCKFCSNIYRNNQICDTKYNVYYIDYGTVLFLPRQQYISYESAHKAIISYKVITKSHILKILYLF